MAFFLSTKGQLHPYRFKYLEGEFETARLERTEIHSEVSTKLPKNLPLEKTEFYAIDVMGHPVITMPSETLIKNIQAAMQTHNIRHIPLVDEKKIVGMISDRDLLKVDLSGTYYFLKASDIMTTVLVVAEEDTPLAHIARVLIEEKLSALPVINKSQEISGMISRTDILRTLVYNRLVLK